MKRIAILLCLMLMLMLMLAAVQPFSAQTRTTPSTSHGAVIKDFDPKRDAATDIRAAVAEATASHRRILLDVGGQWCVWCKYFDVFMDQHPDLRSFRDAHFVVVKINYSEENKNTELLSKYPKVPGYPHFFVLDSDGKFLYSQDTSPLEEGRGYNADRVSDFLHRWALAQK